MTIVISVSKGVRGESNSHPLVHSQPCSDRYTTDTIHLTTSTPTRTRTRDSSLGPRCDRPLHHQGKISTAAVASGISEDAKYSRDVRAFVQHYGGKELD